MLVTLEGLDGSGKTSVWERLQAGRSDGFTFTREPTPTWYGDAVRRSIDTPDADPLAELFLFTADHAAHLQDTIRPALERGEVVLSDRYSDSRYAYQGAAIEGRVPDPVGYVQEVHRPFTREPDLTLYLDVDPETGATRSGSTNKLEQIEFLERVQGIYEDLLSAEPERFVRVDADRELAAVLATIEEILEERVDGWASPDGSSRRDDG
ncbi:MAG: dTMP kinase [Halodesulfurarchaeum sp.]